MEWLNLLVVSIKKLKAFFDLCCSKGLTAEQGVIIPRANVKHLALRQDVVAAVRDGQFTIYAIETIDDCIHLLTGMPVQVIYEKVESRLRTFAERSLKLKQLQLGVQDYKKSTTEVAITGPTTPSKDSSKK